MRFRNHEEPCPNSRQVGKVKHGEPVRLVPPCTGDVKPDDAFIVLDVCSSYRPISERKWSRDKTALANLRTGKLSYVDSTRYCIVLDDLEICGL